MDKSDLVKFRSECIAAHNFYRSLHGTTPLVWSGRLADSAQKWAEQLATADSLTYSNERGIGENIACLWGSEVTGSKVTQIWYEESQNYDYSAPRVTPNTRPFCQVVWQGSRELGAGKASTKNGKQVVVARYNPPASRRQVEKNVKSPKLEKVDGSTTPQVTRACIGLRKFREECLFAHNEFRVLHGAPPLHWSPSLAWAAQQWAEELVQVGELKHNNDEMVGENLAGMIGDELTGKECTDMWYEEVNDFDFENPCYSEETSNFTQVVWMSSELFGVGRASLGDTCIVVAFYEPPGNIEGLFGANVRLQGTKVKSFRLNREMKTFIPPSPDLDWFRIECLVAHNYFRARHGAPPLVIGQVLNEEAQYWAERLLVTGATEDLQESRIGINVAIMHGHHIGGLKVTELWYDEGVGYSFDSPGFSLSTRSFTQLVWLTSRKLGIGKATNGSGQCIIVARYEPVGNIDGLFVANVRPRGHERNALEPVVFEGDLKYRFKVEGRRSFRMSWEIEGTQTLQAVAKTREKNRRKEQSQPAYMSSPETFTRLVWIESPVLPRKQMRGSCDLETEKSDEDKESGVEEGDEFDEEEPSFIMVHPVAEAAATAIRKHLDRAIIYTEPVRTDRYPDVRRSLSLDSEGTEPEPEEGHVLSRVAYFEQFEKKDNAKLDRPKRASLELKEHLQHEQFNNESRGRKINEHEEAICQLEYDDVFPKHDEHDERDDDFASEGEVEEDDDDVMSLETVSEAEEDLLEELDEFDMDHHIKSYCYEVNYPREDEESNIVRNQTCEPDDQVAELIETELDKMDKEESNLDSEQCVVSSVDRDESVQEQMRNVDSLIEFIPLNVEKRKTDFTPEDINFNETEEEKELFNYEIKTIPKEPPSHERPLCTESISSQSREKTECDFNFEEMVSRLNKAEKPKTTPPPTLPKPKPKRKLKEDLPILTNTETIKTVESTQITEHREETVPEPVALQNVETTQNFKDVINERLEEQQPQEEKEDEAPCSSEEEPFESFDVSFIDRERKLNRIFKRLGRHIELIPKMETETTPREFDRNIDLSDTKEEEEIFRVHEDVVVVDKLWHKEPVQEEIIHATLRKREVESEMNFEEMFEKLEKVEETPIKNILVDSQEPSEKLVAVESETIEEEPQEEKSKVVRFNKTVIVQGNERVYNDFVELKEDNAVSDDFQEESAQDHNEKHEEPVVLHSLDEVKQSSDLPTDARNQEGGTESYGTQEEATSRSSPVDKDKNPVQFSDISKLDHCYGTCEVDIIEPSHSVADVYEEYESTPAKHISATSCSQPIQVAADVDNKPLESGVTEKYVRTSMYDTFEEDLSETPSYSVVEPSTEINHSETKAEPLEEKVEVVALLDDEPQSTDVVAVRRLPESNESSLCITTETFYHRTEIVEKRAPSIELDTPLEKEVNVEEEALYNEILPNGHCTSLHISHDMDDTKTEVITENNTYKTETLQELEENEDKFEQLEEAVPVMEGVEKIIQEMEEEAVEETEREEEVEEPEEAMPVMEDAEETVEEKEEITETAEEKGEEDEQPDEALLSKGEVKETVEKEEQTVEESAEENVEEEAEQPEEAVPVTEDVDEAVEEREEETIKETVEVEEEEEETGQPEEAVPVTKDVDDMVQEREEETIKETLEVEEEEEQLEEAVHVITDVERTIEEREEETVDGTDGGEEVEQPEEAVPEMEDAEGTVEEREDETVEETVEEIIEEKDEEEAQQPEEADSIPENVDETVEEREEETAKERVEVEEEVDEAVEEREEETVRETVEAEETEEAVPVMEDPEETVEKTIEEKEEEDEALLAMVDGKEKVEKGKEQTVEETAEENVEEEEQPEEAVPVTEDVDETVKETVEVEEKKVEQPEEAVPVFRDATESEEETVEETAEEKEEEDEQPDEALLAKEDVKETVEKGEEQTAEESAEENVEEETEQPEEAVPVTEEREKETIKETIEVEKDEVEQLEEAVPVMEDVEEAVEKREKAIIEETAVDGVEETTGENEENEQEADIEHPDGSEHFTHESQTEKAEDIKVGDTQAVGRLESTITDDRFEYISEEELEETEELYETLRKSFEEQDSEDQIDEENVHIQQTPSSVMHIGSQENENYEDFAQEPPEDEITYDSEVLTEVEKEITSVMVVKESFSSTVYEDEATNQNIDLKHSETESPEEETQPELLVQFSEPIDEDIQHYNDGVIDERESVEESEELESSDETIDKEVELIQFTEESTGELKMGSGDDVSDVDEKAISESQEQPRTPPSVEEKRDELDSSEEFVEEDVELVQFTENVHEYAVIDEDSSEIDVIEEKQVMTEGGVKLIQFTESTKIEEDEIIESSPNLENVESEMHQEEEEIMDEKAELIQFIEHTEGLESAPKDEEPLEHLPEQSSKKVEIEEEIVYSQPIACSTPIFFPDEREERSAEIASLEDSSEAGFGENYEDMEKIIAHEHSFDISQPITLEESSELSDEFYRIEAEEVASKALEEEFNDSDRLESENLKDVKDKKEQENVKSTSVFTTNVHEEQITTTEHSKAEFIDLSLLDEVTEAGEPTEGQLSPPPTITATEFVADEEEEGSEEEYIPNFEHPRTYMIESKEVVMDRSVIESSKKDEEDNEHLKELDKQEIKERKDEVPSETTIESETDGLVSTVPKQVLSETTTVVVSHRSEVVRKQDSDIDDLEEKEREERIQIRQKKMEETFLQDEIKEDTPDKGTSENKSDQNQTDIYFTSISVVKVRSENDEECIFREEEATNKMREDELNLEFKEPVRDEMNVMKGDEALTEEAFRAERQEEEQKAEDISDEPDQGPKGDEVAQVPIIPLIAASDVAYKTSISDKENHGDVDYQEEIEISRIESSIKKEESLETEPSLLTDVDFTEEVEVEKVYEVEKDPEEIEDNNNVVDYAATNDEYEEEVEIQRIQHQEEGLVEEYHDDEVFEEEVMIEKVEEELEEEQESFPDEESFPVYEEELEVATESAPQLQSDTEEGDFVRAEELHDEISENNEVEPAEEEQQEQAWEEYEEMEGQDQEIPQEIQGIADQSDMHLYDSNNNESLPRYYVDFSPGGSFEHESATSDDGDGPEVYRQGEPMEEDMEEFILVKYEDQSTSSEEDISDHREMYVIHEEDSEDRPDEKKETEEGSIEENVAYDKGFVNPALEDIREEEEENKLKQKPQDEEVDIEEKRQLEEYERLESFVILEEKLSQVESDESVEELTSGTDEKRASSEETLNDEDELSETRTSSTLKDEVTSKDDASGDEVSSVDIHEPSELDSTLTKEVEEETIDLEDGGVLSKRTIREESYTIEEDDGDDDDKDKTLTRRKVSKKVITTTTTSKTHITRIESEDPLSPSGSDNESEHTQKTSTQKEGEDVVISTEQPFETAKGDEELSKEYEESTEFGNRVIETEETIDLDNDGVMKKLVTREETYSTEEGHSDGHDDNDSSITKKTVTKKVVMTTTTSTSRVTRLGEEPSSFPNDDADKTVQTSSEETHRTVIKSRQPEESLISAKRQLSLENSGDLYESCTDPCRKRRGFQKRFESHESEEHSSEVSSTTDSTGDSTSISSEGHVSDEDFSGLDEFQIDCIRQHNIYRHRHRACRLLWSEDLATAAATWAEHLADTNTLEHSPQKESGENLACAKGYDLRGDRVAEMWYDEIEDYNFETPAFNAKCGHFTQMIWRGTKEFGVAKSIADDGSQYIVARYNPPGNVLGEFKDSIRRARGQRSSVRKRRRSSSRRKLSQSSDICDVIQQEKFKNESVISHNYYRSLHGAAPIQWSTMLANEAQTFAEKLTKSGSYMHSGSKDVGECLAFSFGLDLSGRDAVDTWYDEIVDYDYEYPGYTSHTANFTQVVWMGTKEFGMGKAVGEDGSCVVVGRYYPPGNIVGEFQDNVKPKGTGY